MNNNIFKNPFNDLNKGKYNYADKIKWPVKFGVSGDSPGWLGSMTPAINNMEALMYYSDALLLGNNSTGPLGNKYSMQLGYCADKQKGKNSKIKFNPKIVKFNNIPSGNVQISQIPPTAFGKELRGIVPGLIESIHKINPTRFWYDITGKSKCNENFSVNNSNKIIKKNENDIFILLIIITITITILYYIIKAYIKTKY